MNKIALESASPDLVALAAKARAGEEVVLTDHEEPVVKLVPVTHDLPRATPEMIERRLAAFAKLRELNPFRDIEDPVAWQREIRKDASQK